MRVSACQFWGGPRYHHALEAFLSDIGSMLRDARLDKRLSLDEVAGATRIKASYLSALEEGDYSLLPGPAYVTGFLRNYARYLGFHPDDLVQEFHSARPVVQPSVKPATRVLASGYHREHRTRVIWVLGAIALFLFGGYVIKQYSDASAHPYTPIQVTAALGGTSSPVPARSARTVHPFTLQLRATSRVWVRITADNRRVFQGFLRPGYPHRWAAHHGIYVMTFDGARLVGRYDGHRVGILAPARGAMVDLATPHGVHRVS